MIYGHICNREYLPLEGKGDRLRWMRCNGSVRCARQVNENEFARQLCEKESCAAHLLSHPLVPRVCQLPLKGKPLNMLGEAFWITWSTDCEAMGKTAWQLNNRFLQADFSRKKGKSALYIDFSV